ncbi:DUF4145 domain-containing protein [Demequina muriae]|uniref:DUF4145 domain-containing protein n=1 Tax=Demequina muriae TaxID=3051664 RepID=A0ABT8GK55_9MICO|nr:DUF4145 domain-containing protein [Demequina sp. EGI L300058]MDN4481624.1 DUF4145 domain-containing protein [Demequina sp. EGI L300058]
MAANTCGWCNHRTHMAFVKGTYYSARDGQFDFHNAAYQCINCERYSVAYWQHLYYEPDPSEGRFVGDGGGPVPPDCAVWNPPAGARKEFPDVPDHLGAVASEAHLCRATGALRGSVILARSVIEGVAKHLGCDEWGIQAKITWLREQQHIRPKTFEAANALRLAGNDIAHADPGESVTAEECDELLVLMAVVLDEALESDVRLARVKEAREARTGK